MLCAQTAEALDVVPEFCDILADVQEIMERCKVKPVTYDGEFFEDVHIVEGDAAAEEWTSGVTQEELDAANFVSDGCDGVRLPVPDRRGPRIGCSCMLCACSVHRPASSIVTTWMWCAGGLPWRSATSLPPC